MLTRSVRGLNSSAKAQSMRGGTAQALRFGVNPQSLEELPRCEFGGHRIHPLRVVDHAQSGGLRLLASLETVAA